MTGEVASSDTSWREGLIAHTGWACQVYSSPEVAVDRVQALASQTEAAWQYLVDALGVAVDAAVLILDEQDWPSRSTHHVYGMPNADTGRLMIAATSNPFWEDFAEMIRQRPDLVPEVEAVYGMGGAPIDLGGFFDLLATHDLAHLFFESPVQLPCWWVEELTCNLLLHGYVAERQPGALSVLTVFPRAFAAIEPPASWYRSLADFDTHYAYDMDPFNYGWYQCRFHVAAAAIYDEFGTAPARRLRDGCAAASASGRIKKLGNSELLELLDSAAPAFADLARAW